MKIILRFSLSLIFIILSFKMYAPNIDLLKNKFNKVISHKEALIMAISIVESGGDSLIINKAEDAVGFLQIRKIYVDEVNRLSPLSNYKYKDRFSKTKSIEMFEIIMDKKATGYNIDSVACVHNSGNYYWDKTIGYRILVRNAYKNLNYYIINNYFYNYEN